MGYMGTGLQKWIYTMRPRKPFAVSNKATFTALPNYSRTFKLQPSKPSGNFHIFFPLIFLSLFFAIVFVAKPAFLEYSRKIQLQKNERIKLSNKEAFSFLIKSGKRRLKNNDFFGAHSEFKLAYNLNAESKKAFDLLYETTFILCKNENKYCKELDLLVSSY